MPQSLTLPCPILRIATDFHANPTRWLVRDCVLAFVAAHALLDSDLSPLIDPVELKHVLCHITSRVVQGIVALPSHCCHGLSILALTRPFC